MASVATCGTHFVFITTSQLRSSAALLSCCWYTNCLHAKFLAN